ncbi:MAG: hypothetical protein JTT12_05640 [Candidatus Brockarchaeota archaeon]|nr:hypothetical protein [Candidatus Brockarchaeota archaeon]
MGRKVFDTEKDIRIYQAPYGTRGTDLYMHETKKGKKIFYLLHWTAAEDEKGELKTISEKVEIISEKEAKRFFKLRTESIDYYYPSDDEIKYAEQLWSDLYEAV